MPDYGHDLLFGCFLPPAAEQADATLPLAERADQLGLDLVSVQDHPYQPAFLDAWTLLTVIAARTSRIRVFPNVANLPLRPPAVLARAVASLDILSGGRAELGLGAGAFRDAIAAMGGPRRRPGESVAALREAIAVIRALWGQGVGAPGRGIRLAGEHYSLAGAKPGPYPVHPAGIWIGGYQERMLRLTGQAADGWLPSSPYAPVDQLSRMNEIIDEAAATAGRPPAAIRRLYNIAGSFSGPGHGFLQGPPKVWAEQLAELALTEGMSGFVLMAEAAADLELFAQEVAPAARELVERERRQGAPAMPESPREPDAQRAPDAEHGPEAASPASQAARGGQESLGVEPTPDSGQRLSTTRIWDESARPSGPPREAGARYTRAGRSLARELVGVHDHLRAELGQVRDLAAQVAAGGLDPGAARSAINALTIRQNEWTLGAYCESYCRLVGLHHTLEDTAMFPGLRRADGRLAPVVDRLSAEHEAIAGVLTRVDDALVSMVSDPAGDTGEVEATVDLLTDALLSHLSYEERELVEPLARLGPQVLGRY